MTSTREMSRTGSAGGKKRIILARAPRRRKRDDIPLVRLSSSGWFLVYYCTNFSNDILFERMSHQLLRMKIIHQQKSFIFFFDFRRIQIIISLRYTSSRH